jgi:hypothetical protein
MEPLGVTIAIFLFVLIAQIGFTILIERLGRKWSTLKMGNAVLMTLPGMVFFTAIIISYSFFGISFIPRGIENSERIATIEQAEKRIDDLELQTEYLENYLAHERQRQLILVAGLSGIFLLSLFLVGLGMYNPNDQTIEPRSYE